MPITTNVISIEKALKNDPDLTTPIAPMSASPVETLPAIEEPPVETPPAIEASPVETPPAIEASPVETPPAY